MTWNEYQNYIAAGAITTLTALVIYGGLYVWRTFKAFCVGIRTWKMSEDRLKEWRLGVLADRLTKAVLGMVHDGILERKNANDILESIGHRLGVPDLLPKSLDKPEPAAVVKQRISERLGLDGVVTSAKVLKQRLGTAIPLPDARNGGPRNKPHSQYIDIINTRNGHSKTKETRSA